MTKTVKLENGASITWIQDNQGERLNPHTLFSGANDSLLASLNFPHGIPASISTFLLRVDEQNILFDTGYGPFGGQTVEALATLGVSPESINLIYLTHLHKDHISGLVVKDNAGKESKTFKNACVHVSKIEYDAWMNDIPQNDWQKEVMGIYKDNLNLFAFDDTLPCGVLTLNATGHTPGHTAFRFSDLLIIGDLMHGYALQRDHLEINSIYDMDKEKSIESRKRLMQYARKCNLMIAGMHLPPPGIMEL